MKSFNQWIGIGYLGADPESFNTQSGKQLVKINISVSQWKGEGKDEVILWLPVIAFGKTGEYMKSYIKKGDMVHVTGELSYTTKKTKMGDSFKDFVIVASNVIHLPKSKTGEYSSSFKSNQVKETMPQSQNFDDDEIPF